MNYFTKELAAFLKNLEKNNNRDWFDANKPTYESAVKDPFYRFVSDWLELIHKEFPLIHLDPKEAIFRIHKDVRFSKDKTPYKTQVSALVTEKGRKGMDLPGFYLEITAKGAALYSGMYMPNAKQLQALRKHIIYNEEEFTALKKDKAFVKIFKEVGGEKNTVLAAEFKEHADRIPELYNKQFIFQREWTFDEVLDKKFMNQLMEACKAAWPMSTFLSEGVII